MQTNKMCRTFCPVLHVGNPNFIHAVIYMYNIIMMVVFWHQSSRHCKIIIVLKNAWMEDSLCNEIGAHAIASSQGTSPILLLYF